MQSHRRIDMFLNYDMSWKDIQIAFGQIKSIIKMLLVSVRYRKDFLIIETYSYNEAKKIGDFTFKPKVFFFLAGFTGVIISAITIAILYFSPIGYVVLSHQKHPMEDDLIQIAQRLQAVTDSLNANSMQFEDLKNVIRSNANSPLAVSDGFEQLQRRVLDVHTNNHDEGPLASVSHNYSNDQFVLQHAYTEYFMARDSSFSFYSTPSIEDTEPSILQIRTRLGIFPVGLGTFIMY